jgi:hypothetical protein
MYTAKEQQESDMYGVNMPLMLPQGKKRIMDRKAFKHYTPMILGLAISSVTIFFFARKG